jgi:hypothetical protein
MDFKSSKDPTQKCKSVAVVDKYCDKVYKRGICIQHLIDGEPVKIEMYHGK